MLFLTRLVICLWLVSTAAQASAQVLVANDDSFAIPYGLPLEVEVFGVLDNDELDGENAGESGATAQVVSEVSHGTLVLDPKGSFTYTIGPTFDGSDSFVYSASATGAAPVDATVTLTACEGGPEIFTCWNETAFLAKAAEFGHQSFTEGFEDDAV
jgi:VCBS repeat-containing protein